LRKSGNSQSSYYTTHGEGTIRLTLDKGSPAESPITPAPGGGATQEAMHYVTKGRHTLQVARAGAVSLEHLTLKAIPELMHCGVGFNPQIKSYGVYDMAFLKKDILPNVTTLIVANNIKLTNSTIEDWHRQGKHFVAEVGINLRNTLRSGRASLLMHPSSMGSSSTNSSSTGPLRNGSQP
jgi:hypothetical protein